MARRSRRIVIDAHPRGPNGALAEAQVRGVSVLERLVDQAAVLGAEPIAIYAPVMDNTRLRPLAGDRATLLAESTPQDAIILRTDRLYALAALKRALRRGQDPERAVIWRLDTPQAIAGAEQELTRRETYQPLGRYWSLGPARALARALSPTPVRPNALTLSAGGLMLGAAALVAFAQPGAAVQLGVAGMLALALVLDTADGHLARLQGTASEFGRWLDAYLDEMADMALHAAIAWGAFMRDGHSGWLVLGMLYAMGKYQFVVATAEPDTGTNPTSVASHAKTTRSPLADAVRLIGHADVRWHLWIVLAALGRLDVALIVYALYFPVRALAVAIRKGVRSG